MQKPPQEIAVYASINLTTLLFTSQHNKLYLKWSLEIIEESLHHIQHIPFKNTGNNTL